LSVAGDPAARRQSDRVNFFRNASFDGGEVSLRVDGVEKGLVIFGEQ
jgi:hypothetical protein